MRTSTTSTTRTSVLPCAASFMRSAAPVWSSSANSSIVLVSPTPNLLVSMLCSLSIFSTVPTSTFPTSPSVERTCDTADKSWISWLIFSSVHHSYRTAFPVCLSSTSNLFGCIIIASCCLPRESSFFSCFFSSRSMSSLRRSSCNALAPPSRRPSASNFSAAPEAGSSPPVCSCTQACFRAAEAAKRLDSSFSMRPIVNSRHFVGQKDGNLGCFVLTSASFLKGKRPSTKPYMITPKAHISTLSP
mmetsp:Transcript_11839/g.31936  ORF Transcript_11839/g.31936 Transcript_11839/m.31936 type:complete len:245 (+) Transcript_11839:1111-1845(+)